MGQHAWPLCEGPLGGRSSQPLTLPSVLSPQRRQEEGYYSRLEAERRRQHEEAARRLLEPEEPGLCRPPLPRDYEPQGPAPAPGAPPPPPQRNTSYLKTQALAPDSLFTAKFVAYSEEEEEAEEDCGLAGQEKHASTRKSLGHLPAAERVPQPRPVSGGIFLSTSCQPPSATANSTAPKARQPPSLPKKPSCFRPGQPKGRGPNHARSRLCDQTCRWARPHGHTCFTGVTLPSDWSLCWRDCGPGLSALLCGQLRV